MIVDHPTAPPVSFPSSTDTLFVTLSDWYNLHRMIRSTAGVIDYVERALASGVSVRLGYESDRFMALSNADLGACTTLSTFPTLYPMELSDDEALSAALVDDLVEQVADPQNLGFHDEDYLRIVEQLDQIPLHGRVRLGSKMRETLATVANDRARRCFIITDGSVGQCLKGNRLVFMYDHFNFLKDGVGAHRFPADVAGYAALRQTQALQHGASALSATLGIGVIHDPQLGRRYVFCWISGVPNLPPGLTAQLQDQYGTFDGTAVR